MGSGRVLTGLLRRINRSVQGCNVQDANSLEKTLGYFRSNAEFEVADVAPA